jgi:hypothetical protein
MDKIISEANILLAYRNVKKNVGSKTKGTDGKTIANLAKYEPKDLVILVRNKLRNFQPQKVRRVEIPKPDGKMRPLGIPTISDRLVQQCILQVMEPICEAKFYKHSYGFRPLRGTKDAIARAQFLAQMNNLHYVVDVDIKGFFDNIDHGKLLKQIWSLGIRDKALLSIISKMLKAEVEGIDCFLTYYDDNANLVSKELWTKFDRFQIDIDTILNKQFYRLNVIEYNFPRIYLKLPNTGKDLRVGTVVEMNILVTSGIDGEMTELPKTDEIICEIIDYKLKLQGTNEETIESIKYNAPLFYNSANRAVTKNDFISICNRLTSIDKTYVWDGNDEYPQKQGMIWFSFIPQTRDRVFESDMFRSVYRLENPYDKVNWFLEDLEFQKFRKFY